MQDAAKALAGPLVVVRFRDPPTKGAFGECYRLENGVLVVDISPGLASSGLMKSFCMSALMRFCMATWPR